MVVNVNYGNVIEEMAVQIKELTVEKAILKAQLEAVTKELNNILEQANEVEQGEVVDGQY